MFEQVNGKTKVQILTSNYSTHNYITFENKIIISSNNKSQVLNRKKNVNGNRETNNINSFVCNLLYMTTAHINNIQHCTHSFLSLCYDSSNRTIKYTFSLYSWYKLTTKIINNNNKKKTNIIDETKRRSEWKNISFKQLTEMQSFLKRC